MKKVRQVLVAAFSFAILPAMVSAQTAVGKISGKVTDAETGEPLPGANIVIAGTQLGAATDLDGEYFILNLVPGTYTLRFTFVGYQPQVFQDIRVVAGITKEVDAKKKSAAVELGELVVIAEKPFFEAKATNTVKVYDSEEISALPVRGVDRVVGLQAGSVTADGSGGVDENATINVRGGRGNELVYIVDGVAQNDPLFSSNNSQVSQDAIEQVSFQVGGYEAKYGQAQSGIVNLTTKTGGSTYSFTTDVQSSRWTDDFGYNLYNASVSGPLLPNLTGHTFFVLAERGLFGDSNPNAIGIRFKTTDPPVDSKKLPGNGGKVWRGTARTTHNLFGKTTLRLGANLNENDIREYTHRYAKFNSAHNPRDLRRNQSYSGRLSVPFTAASFLNVNLGFKRFSRERGDGVFFDNMLAYGDTSDARSLLPNQAVNLDVDPVGIFFREGRVFNSYFKLDDDTYSVDADFTLQAKNHLFEAGGGGARHTLRYFGIVPMALALNKDKLTVEERFRNVRPFLFGYDITGQRKTKSGEREPVDNIDLSPKEPVVLYGYVQDRYELKNLVLNFGVRFDYYDTKADILRDERVPFQFGDPARLDDADFKQVDAEFFVSPRIGFGFPVTPTTVFHAQFGRFIQQVRLIDLYTTTYDLRDLESDNNLPVNTGNLKSEKTTQYEIGFRQILGENVAAINLTAFYKNTQDLVNDQTRFFFRREGGQELRYYGPANTDFGTVRGLAFSLDLARQKYISMALNYTYSISEGTGSSTSSSSTAAFRNNRGEIPNVITPLDFDQRHTGTLNVGFNTRRGELGLLENVSLNLLTRFSSGRPYTPLESQNILAGVTNFGDTRGYVNSAYGPGIFRIDLKAEKQFEVGGLRLRPYVWIENLLNSENIINVYRSTGSAYTTGYLNTIEGRAVVASRPDPEAYRADYETLERDPVNFGIPRTIRVGMNLNLSNVRF
jgi:hypothetical protein